MRCLQIIMQKTVCIFNKTSPHLQLKFYNHFMLLPSQCDIDKQKNINYVLQRFLIQFPVYFSPDNLSLEDIQSLLRSAWLTLQHFPSPTLYPTLSTLLALTTGQQDPVATAMLHVQSLGITSRHRTIRHLSSCLK